MRGVIVQGGEPVNEAIHNNMHLISESVGVHG